jgi:hypothetical protein
MRQLKGKSGRADVRAVDNLADPLAGSERVRRCAPGSVQPILFDPSAGMMLRAVVANNRPVPVVPVAPSRRRRPSRKSAALGADDGAMEWKGRQRSYSRRSPGSSGAEVEVRLVRIGAMEDMAGRGRI